MNKEVEDLCNTINPINLIYLYRIIEDIYVEELIQWQNMQLLKDMCNTFHGKASHMPGHRTRPDKCKGTEIIPKYVLRTQLNEMRSQQKRKFAKVTNLWKLNNSLLNNKWDEEEITKNLEKYFEIKTRSEH